jgi:hypothetical protein
MLGGLPAALPGRAAVLVCARGIVSGGGWLSGKLTWSAAQVVGNLILSHEKLILGIAGTLGMPPEAASPSPSPSPSSVVSLPSAWSSCWRAKRFIASDDGADCEPDDAASATSTQAAKIMAAIAVFLWLVWRASALETKGSSEGGKREIVRTRDHLPWVVGAVLVQVCGCVRPRIEESTGERGSEASIGQGAPPASHAPSLRGSATVSKAHMESMVPPSSSPMCVVMRIASPL